MDNRLFCPLSTYFSDHGSWSIHLVCKCSRGVVLSPDTYMYNVYTYHDAWQPLIYFELLLFKLLSMNDEVTENGRKWLDEQSKAIQGKAKVTDSKASKDSMRKVTGYSPLPSPSVTLLHRHRQQVPITQISNHSNHSVNEYTQYSILNTQHPMDFSFYFSIIYFYFYLLELTKYMRSFS